MGIGDWIMLAVGLVWLAVIVVGLAWHMVELYRESAADHRREVARRREALDMLFPKSER